MSDTEESGTEEAGKEAKAANVVKRPELLAHVVETVGLPRARTVAVVDAFLEGVGKALADGKEVRLPGFGAFVVSNRAAGKGRDPRTGEEIDVPASKSVRFRPAKALKESVNG